MSTYSQRVSSALDDANKNDEGYFSNTGSIWIGNGISTDWDAALRFTNLEINRGSTINEARIKLTTDGDSPEADDVEVKCNIYCIDEDDTDNFSSDPFGRDRTDASGSWTVTVSPDEGHTYTTVDIKSCVQEVIDRGGWERGNHLGFFFNHKNEGYIGSFYDRDDSSSKCALLEIDYTQAVTTTTTTTTSTSTSTSTTSSSTTTNSTTTLPIPASLVTGIVRVTKEGKDVIESNLLDDFFIDSNYPLLKIHDYGSFETGITGLATIDHNLGYIPYAMVFSQYLSDDGAGDVTISDEYYQHDWFLWGATYYSTGFTKIYNDKLDITIENILQVRPGVLKGFYYIFKEEVI